jgi:hypothetical protein
MQVICPTCQIFFLTIGIAALRRYLRWQEAVVCSTKKQNPRPIPGAGFSKSFDDDDMQVICPTWQVLFRKIFRRLFSRDFFAGYRHF